MFFEMSILSLPLKRSCGYLSFLILEIFYLSLTMEIQSRYPNPSTIKE
ncbi:hypothetical protein D3OALGA1CA_4014 [Olavius algarvensis associated proteobacterium Delta 3]|nr:hypothetical protein D3OALGB2SA_3411 [Olavius algarvensis associated proteobacterium Delta 3]CAB5143732.1 hypothetical protein D3OALGA1CA_4014 [Olavius algarvensis associated proteobacterium Delta 3]